MNPIETLTQQFEELTERSKNILSKYEVLIETYKKHLKEFDKLQDEHIILLKEKISFFDFIKEHGLVEKWKFWNGLDDFIKPEVQ